MENASKALIIAGAILLALLIISLGVMIFNTMSNSVKSNTSLDQQTISAFNSKLEIYIGETKSGSQVNTLRQLAISINNNAVVSDELYKTVKLSITKKGESNQIMTQYNSTDKRVDINPIKADTGKFYKVEIVNYTDGLISEIKATEI